MNKTCIKCGAPSRLFHCNECHRKILLGAIYRRDAQLRLSCPTCKCLLVVQENADRSEVVCRSCGRAWGGQDYLGMCLGGASMKDAKEAER